MDTIKEKEPPPAAPPADGARPAPNGREDKTAPEQEYADARTSSSPPPPPPGPSPKEQRRKRWRIILIVAGVIVAVAIGAYFLIPLTITAVNTVSTDDAYVNSHVTFVAPRVGGKITDVLVDDNVRVKRGDLLAQLDKEPYRVQVNIRKAAVTAAESDLSLAHAQVRGLEAQARGQVAQLETAINDVRRRVRSLQADVEVHKSKKASRELAEANLKRGQELLPVGGISKEDVDQRRRALEVAEAEEQQALQNVYADRVYLGLPAQPAAGHSLKEVPADIDQTFSGVRAALATLLQTTAQLGLPLPSTELSPDQVLAGLRQKFSGGDVDRLFEDLISNAPAVKQAEAKLLQAQRDLEQAVLNLSYSDIVSDIDGIVTRRNVNPGNNVQLGQAIMAIRSVRQIWIDANFKESQLSDLRIGQRARLVVDMYGSKHEFSGRITGFSMGTGSSLSLLPAQNATGNYVKVVQRLPVRIELTNYDPNKDTLFVGLSVTPYVYYKEPPTGPHAGDRLQPDAKLPVRPVNPIVPPSFLSPTPPSQP